MSETAPHVGIGTGERAPELTADGQALQSALRKRGYVTDPVIWTDSDQRWSTFDAVVVRSCWRYYRRPGAFERWLDALRDAGVTVLNPSSVIRWNIHKSYLAGLESPGVSLPPTAWIDAGSDVDLDSLLDRRTWTEAVVKPAIGTSSDGVWRVSDPVGQSDCERFENQLADSDLLVQQFVPEIRRGELSLVFFGGEYSHAFRTVPAADDFRSHPDYGGTVRTASPAPDLTSTGESIVQRAATACGVAPENVVYARVDGVERDGRFLLLELELIEPYLGLTDSGSGTERFADAIESHLESTLSQRTNG